MDVTILFKACVKKVRTTDKYLGNKEQRNSILNSKSLQRDPFLSRAKDVIRQLTGLQQLLNDNKQAYLNVLNSLSSSKSMSESEREQIEETAGNVISSCGTLIKGLRHEASAKTEGKQKQEHYLNVVASLEAYLKLVSRIYAEAKAVRVKKVLETHKISKLKMKRSMFEATEVTTTKPIPPQTNSTFEEESNQLSAEELQMFESENEQLFSELNSLSEEVNQIESKVVHIAELQQLFTEKVLEQDKDIDRIGNIVAATTDNVRDANEQIRQAIQRNAGLRVWVLFFLLVMSFSLLFLDWYNE